MRFVSLIIIIFCAISMAYAQQNTLAMDTNRISRSEQEWRSMLTPEQYNVCRLGGTEPPGSGKYNKFYEKGIYTCAACGLVLFHSGTKFDSGSGWPSFYNEHNKGNITYKKDTRYGMLRVELTCARCDAHLGHVFEDGPEPTGLRYCINSLSLNFIPDKEKNRESEKHTK